MGSAVSMFLVFCCFVFLGAFTASNADLVTVHGGEDERGNCPAGWVDTSLFGARMGCLLFNVSTAYTWDQANKFCYTQEEGRLVEIRSEWEMELIMNYLEQIEILGAKHSWWTSGTDYSREGEHVWLPSLTDVGSYFWDSSQPNGGSRENCLCLYSSLSYKGGDCFCTVPLMPICQKK